MQFYIILREVDIVRMTYYSWKRSHDNKSRVRYGIIEKYYNIVEVDIVQTIIIEHKT